MLLRIALLLFAAAGASFAQLVLTPAPAPPLVVGESFGTTTSTQQFAAANNGTAPYSWTLVSGTVPPGLQLSATTNGDGQGSLSGTLSTTGTFSFTLAAQDSSTPPQSATQTYTVTVTVAPLTITPATLPGGAVGASYPGGNLAEVPSAVGGIPPFSWSLLSGTLPPGMSLYPQTPTAPNPITGLPNTGALHGTPTNPGTYAFTLKVVDSSPTPLTATQVFSFSVANVIEYPDTQDGGEVGIAAGPDGALWFSDPNSIATDSQGNGLSGIDRITTAGVFTVPAFPLPQILSGGVLVSPVPQWITAGSDGTLWFTEPQQEYIGQMTTAGKVGLQYNLPILTVAGMQTYLYPNGITGGPDGAIWFTVYGQFGAPYGAIGRIAATPDHAVAYYQITTNGASNPQGIVAGPDGALWFTDTGFDQSGNPIGYIGRMTVNGTLSPPAGCTAATRECAIPGTTLSAYSSITAGPDGALWFTDQITNQIGRITTDGTSISLYTVPTSGAGLIGIATGSDGALWFTESSGSASAVGRITTAGVITEFPTPTTGSSPQGIASGPDGALWFTEPSAPPGGQIGRLTPPLGLSCNLPLSIQVGATLASGLGCKAFGGVGPYTYTVSGALPSGLTLNPSTGAVTGTPSEPGTFTFIMEASGSGSPAQTAQQQITMSAAPRQPLLFTCTFPAGAQDTIPYSASCTTSGGIAPYLYAISAGSLPPGLTLTTVATGLTISGTPSSYGAFSFTVQASDSGTPVYTAVQQVLAFAVLPPPLVLTCSAANRAEVNIAFLKTCTANGGIPPYTYATTAAIPSWLSIDPSGGSLTGTPTNTGTSSFSVQVHDSGPPVQNTALPASITVIPPKLAVMCDFTEQGEVGQHYSTSCPVTNGTAPYKYKIAVGALPDGLTLNPTTGAIAGSPTAQGTFRFTLVVTDNESPVQSAQQAISYSVLPVKLTILTNSVPDGDVALPYSANPSLAGGVSPYKWSISAGALPSGLALNTTSGAITGTPKQTGSFSFILKATDSSKPVESATQAFSGMIAGPVDPDFEEYSLPSPSGLGGLVTGPDGALWFSSANLSGGNIVGRITTAGAITTIPSPNPLSDSASPGGITTGPDNTIWFVETIPSRVGQVTVGGTAEIDYPTTTTSAEPRQIVSGPNGALWFTETASGSIGEMSPNGLMLNEYPTKTAASQPSGIVVGSDNALWFTESATSKIGRITANGSTQKEFAIPTRGAEPASIALGPDGGLWFTETGAGKIGRISPQGAIEEYPTLTPGSGPEGIVAGSDGTLYFTEANANQLGRITTNGVVTEYPLPVSASDPQGIALGPDGAIWLAESAANKIARFSFAGQLLLSCTFPTLGRAALGTSYSSTCSTSKGTPPYTYSIGSGTLPPGLSLNPVSGAITGALSTGGSYSFSVRVTDAGLPAQSATEAAPKVTVLPAALTLTCNTPTSAEVGSSYSGNCSGAGGTPPYTYSISSGSLPSGLTLNTAGTISGTPSAAGTFSFTVSISDAGSPSQIASQALSVAVQFGVTTSGGGALFALVGLPQSQSPGQSITNASVQLNQAIPAAVTGTVALGFTPYSGDAGLPSGYMDPALQFTDGSGRNLGINYNFTLPAGVVTAALPIVDPGTVAGGISFTLTANGVPQANSTVFVVPAPPTIEEGSVQATNVTSDGFDIEFVATSTTREATVATFTFTPASGANISGLSSFVIDVSAVLASWLASDRGLSYGGAFSLTVPFKLSGTISAIQSVSVTLSNSIGTSAAVSGNI